MCEIITSTDDSYLLVINQCQEWVPNIIVEESEKFNQCVENTFVFDDICQSKIDISETES